MASVTLTNLSKSYLSGAVAASGVNLDAQDGRVTVIVGPSGAGKSTILRIIAGLETPTKGEVLINGHCVTALAPVKRDVAMVFQDAALYPYLSVRGNLAFPLKRLKFSAEEKKLRIEQTAALMGIEELLERRPHELSGGEAQRVALGRGLIGHPKALLLDEPLSSLDPPLRLRLRREIARLQQQTGVTMLYVTHDQDEAIALADHLVVMHQGRVQQQGAPQELYRRPANRFVARFLGSPGMNLIAGKISDNQFSGSGIEVAAGGIANGPVCLGLRPEDLALAGDGPTLAKPTVQRVEVLGGQSLVHLDSDGHLLIARVPGIATVECGQAIPVLLRPDASLHWYAADKEGNRLN